MKICQVVLFVLVFVCVSFVGKDVYAFSIEDYWILEGEFPVIIENQGKSTEFHIIRFDLNTKITNRWLPRQIQVEKEKEGITSLEGLEQYPYPDKVKQILIRDTNIRGIPPRLFSKFRNLEVLMVCQNRLLTKIPENMCSGLPHLRQLDLSGNRIIQVPRRLLRGLKGLETVSFEGNRLTHISKFLFKDNQRLKMINLAYNQFSRFSPQIFTYVPNLEMLLVYNNPVNRYTLREKLKLPQKKLKVIV
jgi:hypothetical protein